MDKLDIRKIDLGMVSKFTCEEDLAEYIIENHSDLNSLIRFYDNIQRYLPKADRPYYNAVFRIVRHQAKLLDAGISDTTVNYIPNTTNSGFMYKVVDIDGTVIAGARCVIFEYLLKKGLTFAHADNVLDECRKYCVKNGKPYKPNPNRKNSRLRGIIQSFEVINHGSKKDSPTA